MRDATLIVDLFTDFEHDDGGRLLASFRERAAGIRELVETSRQIALPLVFCNDNFGAWDGHAGSIVERALAGKGGELLAPLAPRPGEAFVVKPRYSAFDHTPLELLLRELEVERILLAGMATEMCVAQTAIDARELGWKVTVLAGACAAVDPANEQTALDYLSRVAGVHLEPTLAIGGGRTFAGTA